MKCPVCEDTGKALVDASCQGGPDVGETCSCKKPPVFKFIEGKDIVKPGKYICAPVAAMLKLAEPPDYVMIVDVYEWKSEDCKFLVYRSDDGEEYTLHGCGHAFYGPLT